MTRLTSVEAINTFAFGGNATLTLRSVKTDTRFTYRIKASDDGRVWFVSVLQGPNNDQDYAYLGTFRAGGDYSHGRKSRIAPDSPSARAMDFFAQEIKKASIHPALEVYHEGRCGHCNRKLTTPESILTGFGPDCTEKLGLLRAIVCDSGEDALAKLLAA